MKQSFNITINYTLTSFHKELVDVEPAAHGEGVQAAEVQTRDDEMAIKLRSLISLRCDDLDTLVDRQ